MAPGGREQNLQRATALAQLEDSGSVMASEYLKILHADHALAAAASMAGHLIRQGRPPQSAITAAAARHGVSRQKLGAFLSRRRRV
jgi:hypothetical protein